METWVLFLAVVVCLRMGGGAWMWLESEESLGSVGMEVGPPDGKDPRMGSSFDEALGDP